MPVEHQERHPLKKYLNSVRGLTECGQEKWQKQRFGGGKNSGLHSKRKIFYEEHSEKRIRSSESSAAGGGGGGGGGGGERFTPGGNPIRQFDVKILYDR